MNTIDEIDLHLAKAQEITMVNFPGCTSQLDIQKHIQIARKLLDEISLDKVLIKFKDKCSDAIKEAGVKLDRKRCPNCNSELSKL